ncbi:hypothetical protein F7R06_09765 [Pseudomonas moorei]|nr:hypothetical protein F7R06_09765 [Pseudomonas moorei]
MKRRRWTSTHRSNAPPVGASLLAMACQSTPVLLILHRERARSYRDLCRAADLCPSVNPELAQARVAFG